MHSTFSGFAGITIPISGISSTQADIRDASKLMEGGKDDILCFCLFILYIFPRIQWSSIFYHDGLCGGDVSYLLFLHIWCDPSTTWIFPAMLSGLMCDIFPDDLVPKSILLEVLYMCAVLWASSNGAAAAFALSFMDVGCLPIGNSILAFDFLLLSKCMPKFLLFFFVCFASLWPYFLVIFASLNLFNIASNSQKLSPALLTFWRAVGRVPRSCLLYTTLQLLSPRPLITSMAFSRWQGQWLHPLVPILSVGKLTSQTLTSPTWAPWFPPQSLLRWMSWLWPHARVWIRSPLRCCTQAFVQTCRVEQHLYLWVPQKISTRCWHAVSPHVTIMLFRCRLGWFCRPFRAASSLFSSAEPCARSTSSKASHPWKKCSSKMSSGMRMI